MIESLLRSFVTFAWDLVCKSMSWFGCLCVSLDELVINFWAFGSSFGRLIISNLKEKPFRINHLLYEKIKRYRKEILRFFIGTWFGSLCPG